jgi:FMN phosphatase YigB (HAD superfamily)
MPDIPDAVILSYEVGLVKPDPAIFRLVYHQLRCQPKDILFVGDMPAADIEGPCTIGMPAMLISEFEPSMKHNLAHNSQTMVRDEGSSL